MGDYPEDRRTYVSFSERGGWPAGPSLYYRCLRCGDVLPSLPEQNVECSCDNIQIDIDYGRLHVGERRLVEAFLFDAP